MLKDNDTLRKIAEESRRYIGMVGENAEEKFRESVLENLFLKAKELGYEERIPIVEQRKKEIIVGKKLKIKATLVEVEERKVRDQLFTEWVDGEVRVAGVEWGILINPKGLWLFNNQVQNKSKGFFQSGTNVLEIIHGKNTDQEYFEFFSYDNIMGLKLGANYFRDIIKYKNYFYKGSEKSWRAYHSALKRFFKYYSGSRGYFKNETGSIYDEIYIPDFQEYVTTKTKIQKENTLNSAFFYIKDFMMCMTDNGAFDISTKELVSVFSRKFEIEEKQNIIEPARLKKVVQYLQKGKNKERDVAMFLMLLAFGIERRRLCSLRWNDIEIQDGRGVLKQEARKVPIPSKLIETLGTLENLGISSKYVFYRTKNNKEEPMRESAVNEVFSRLVNIEPKDAFYKLITPANIRSSLVQYLFRQGYPLEEIMYLMNIEIWNLGNYLSREDIDLVVSKRRGETVNDSVPSKSCVKIHPMDSFLEQLFS